MITKFLHTLILGVASVSLLHAQGFYQFGTDQGESIPLKWKLNLNAVYDDNVGAGRAGADGRPLDKEGSLALNPSAGASMTHVTPQTTADIFGHLGFIYYLDSPNQVDDTFSQSRLSFNLIHRFSERIRFSSTNFISYELEPDYAYGYATTRTGGETLFWETDNAVGYRISERLGSYTGILVKQTDSDGSDNDRLSGQVYTQLRYQYSPQTIMLFDYRYEMVDARGPAHNATNQYILLGAEHMFTQNITGVMRAGVQLRDLETRDSATNPHVEANIIARPNSALRLRSFIRYSVEDYDTVQNFNGRDAEYADRSTLRFGVAGDYVINPSFSLVSGLDYIPTRYRDGRFLNDSTASRDVDEDVINFYIGLNYRINDFMMAKIGYNYSHADSDFPTRDYDRNRISLGVSAEF